MFTKEQIQKERKYSSVYISARCNVVYNSIDEFINDISKKLNNEFNRNNAIKKDTKLTFNLSANYVHVYSQVPESDDVVIERLIKIVEKENAAKEKKQASAMKAKELKKKNFFKLLNELKDDPQVAGVLLDIIKADE